MFLLVRSRRCRGELFGPSTTSSTASPVLCRRCTEDLQASPPNPQHISLGSHDVATLPLCLFRIPHLPVLASCVSVISPPAATFAATAVLVCFGGGTCFAFVSDTPPVSWAFRFEGLPNISVSYCPVLPNGRVVLRYL